MEIEIPFRDNEIIRKKADDFRKSLAPEGCDLPPLDVLYIVDVILRLDIIELPDLFRDQHIDAALLPDLSGLYVDQEELRAWDKKDHWTERRLRFSVAHEIGHYVLHGEIMKNFFPTLEVFKKWAGNRENYGSAEYQADEFAGRLLVPRDILLREYDLYCRKVDAADPEWRNVEGMREHVARKLSPRFGVNHQVIETRLDHENIWPVD
jgi:Zn-dependent peptidase ImmA (M78 family)